MARRLGAGEDMVSGWLNEAAGSGLPFRLTLQQAARVSAPAAGDIHVCENPVVLRVAAGELGTSSAALVCTEGVPSAACHAVLGKAAARGAAARAGRLRLDRAAHRQCRHDQACSAAMADDGERLSGRARGGRIDPVTGPATGSPWDPRLASLMAEHGRVVMEERLITTLIADLKA